MDRGHANETPNLLPRVIPTERLTYRLFSTFLLFKSFIFYIAICTRKDEVSICDCGIPMKNSVGCSHRLQGSELLADLCPRAMPMPRFISPVAPVAEITGNAQELIRGPTPCKIDTQHLVPDLCVYVSLRKTQSRPHTAHVPNQFTFCSCRPL